MPSNSSCRNITLGTACGRQKSYQLEKETNITYVKIPSIAGVPSFYMQETETTFAQWMEYCKETFGENADRELSRYEGPNSKDRPNHPVRNITPAQAQDYCNWLSKKIGKEVSLPTKREYFTLIDISEILGKKEANIESTKTSSRWSSDPQTKEVKSYPPDKYGLYDIIGNVSEMTITEEGGITLRGYSYADRWLNLSGTAIIAKNHGNYPPDAEIGFRTVLK